MEKIYDEQKAINKLTDYELERIIPLMNLGFNFYGIHVLCTDYKISFYDEENNLLYSKPYESCGDLRVDLGYRLNAKFEDKKGNTLSYRAKINRDTKDWTHSFFLDSKDNRDLCVMHLLFNHDNTILKEINVKAINADEDYTTKELCIDEDSLKVGYDNQSGHFGDYDNGTVRQMSYCPSTHSFPFMYMDEWVGSYQKGVHKSLYGGLSGLWNGANRCSNVLTDKQYDRITLNIASHPRNKETIETILDMLDEKMLGIKDFVTEYFPVYNTIMKHRYVHEPFVDNLIENNILSECNFKNKKSSLRLKNKNTNN